MDLAIGGIDVLAHQAGPVRLQPVPDDQQSPLDMCPQHFEEFHDLRTSDCPVVKAKHTLGLGHPCDYRQLLPVEVKLNDRGLPYRRPGLDPRGAFGQSGFVDEDNYPALLLGFF